jgi:hypothetical protein
MEKDFKDEEQNHKARKANKVKKKRVAPTKFQIAQYISTNYDQDIEEQSRPEKPKKNQNTLDITGSEEEIEISWGKANSNSLDQKLGTLVKKLQEGLSERISNAISERYQKINYLFRFFECAIRIFEAESHTKNDVLYQDIKKFRILVIHILPFFISRPEIINDFTNACSIELSKKLNYQKNIRLQMQEIVRNININEQIKLLNTNPFTCKDNLRGPKDLINDIKTALSHLTQVINTNKTPDDVADEHIHGITILLSFYWELVHHFSRYRSNKSLLKPDFNEYEDCLKLLASYTMDKDELNNELTRYAKSFRNDRFAHIGKMMIINISQISFKSIKVYNSEARGYNKESFIEQAASAKNYLDDLEKIFVRGLPVSFCS